MESRSSASCTARGLRGSSRTCQRERGIWEGVEKRNKDMGERGRTARYGKSTSIPSARLAHLPSLPIPSRRSQNQDPSPRRNPSHTRAVAKRTRESGETRAAHTRKARNARTRESRETHLPHSPYSLRRRRLRLRLGDEEYEQVVPQDVVPTV
jgi:hypothetical protein